MSKRKDFTIGSGGVYLPFARVRQWFFVGVVLSTGGIGAVMMTDIIGDNGVSLLELIILALFVTTFTWISVPFWNAVIGFFLILLQRDPLSLQSTVHLTKSGGAISNRTALIMPIRNEDPNRVIRGIAAVLESLRETRYADKFDLYLLSDTNDESIIVQEEKAWAWLCRNVESSHGLSYHRREVNIGRKAGNIADFCQRWGDEYEYMVILDADSLMTGETLVRLVQSMERAPNAGLMQTVPVPTPGTTLFGRSIQFSACLYSRMLATGQSFWQTDAANYWGHNAILRITPFRQHCMLPKLSGKPPFGGEVLSHDFVEAALMRRAGWSVFLLPSLGGSYEGAPENVIDYAKRDRRWSQGSLQHLRLLFAGGFHLVSRLHMFFGACGYLSSVVWFLLLLVSTAYVLFPVLSSSVLTTEPWNLTTNTVSLLLATVCLLFSSKFLGLILALIYEKNNFGGLLNLLGSFCLEIVLAFVIAPVMMMYHTRFVVSILTGHDVSWGPQIRDRKTLPWHEIFRGIGWITLFGLLWAGITLYFSPLFFLWLSPVFLGLLFAVPLVSTTGNYFIGQWVGSQGFFQVHTDRGLLQEVSAGSR
tara:strand:+ start:1427 stop:3196 length:1770 start_codon:yes stop_codon:yes gene_type:complete